MIIFFSRGLKKIVVSNQSSVLSACHPILLSFWINALVIVEPFLSSSSGAKVLVR